MTEVACEGGEEVWISFKNLTPGYPIFNTYIYFFFFFFFLQRWCKPACSVSNCSQMSCYVFSSDTEKRAECVEPVWLLEPWMFPRWLLIGQIFTKVGLFLNGSSFVGHNCASLVSWLKEEVPLKPQSFTPPLPLPRHSFMNYPVLCVAHLFWPFCLSLHGTLFEWENTNLCLSFKFA